MTELPRPDPEPGRQRAYRWQTLFQRAREPVFLLNRQRRLVFVNRAWEEFTGWPAAEVRGLACRRHKDPEPDGREVLAGALVVPPEALAGRPARARRLVVDRRGLRRWCDVDFFPVPDEAGQVSILGKITFVAAEGPAVLTPLPEDLAALRQARAQYYRLDYLASAVPAGDPVLGRLGEQARLAAQTRVPVLFRGEPGTGKQWLARAVHYHSAAREAAFVALDCAHLPPRALAGLLFGEGGLVRRGRLGTLYLKEPARLPRDLQDRLTALVAESGERGPRVMAGSTADPAAEVREGHLRDDLHCALGTLVLELPPLRNRPAVDLPGLAERLLARAAEPGAPVPALTPEAWEVVYAYRWPGNVRELAAVLAGAAARARSRPGANRIDAADLPAYLRLARTPEPAAPRPLPLDRLLEETERRLIALALRLTQGHKSRAADLLGIWRQRMVRRMEQLGIEEP